MKPERHMRTEEGSMQQIQIAERAEVESVLPLRPISGVNTGYDPPAESGDDAPLVSDLWDRILCAAILAGLGVLLYQSIFGSWFRPVILDAENERWARLVLRPAILWGAMGALLVAFRTVLWFRYRSSPPATMEDAPSLTVIIPAYNEGAMVLQSIESVARAHYPRERLEILVVDDGSRDDTWEHIQRAAARYPELVSTRRQPENRGKREALAYGFENARGEVVVTLDSDSVIDPGALLALAGPFRNPRVGAVAGKVKVYNRREGFIPRMLHVRFIISFDMLRASESGYGTVYCCPGALTAYRISLVRQLVKRWLGQKFLGAPCLVGEDRALTNLVLASGHDTVYQRSAVVHTVAPASYKKLCRMFLRWDRSYVREELLFLRLVWRRPLRARVIALCDRLITNLRYPVHYACVFLLAFTLPHHPFVLLRLLTVVGGVSAINMLYYLRSERSPDFFYGILYSYYSLFTLFWIFPAAVFTVRSRSWLTR
jgi:hyaluronan synthase